jgi:hypothetical protein
MMIPLTTNESDHTHNLALDSYITISINYQGSKHVKIWLEQRHITHNTINLIRKSVNTVNRFWIHLQLCLNCVKDVLDYSITQPIWSALDRTPPPPVRRHHQIAASGRDP